MAIDNFLVSCILLSALPLVHLIVPPKTPVLSGFEPAAIGSIRELVCDAYQPDVGTITYEWYKYSVNASDVENWENKGPTGTNQKYILSPVTEKKVFYQGSTEESVSGKYMCRASNSAGTRDSEWGGLYVYKPCSGYTVSVSPAKPAIGSTFTLNCHIPIRTILVTWYRTRDDPSVLDSVASAISISTRNTCNRPSNPRYSWSRCSPPSTSSRTFNLRVTNAQTSDSAYFVCHALGQSCGWSNPVMPVVQAIPGTPRITGFPSSPVTAGHGTQLNLKCVATPPGDAYDWYKDGTKVTSSLTYDFHVRNESGGVYKCVAKNDVGSTPSTYKILIVYYKPDFVAVSSEKNSSHVGETDRFTCAVTGGYPNPCLKIYWKRSGGTPVEVTQGQARVMAQEDNQAEYYCEAKVPGYPALDVTSSKKTYNVTAAQNVPTFTITRNKKLVTVLFGPLIKDYSSFQLWFCGPGQTPKTTGCSASFVLIQDPAKSRYTIHVTNETEVYVFYLDLYYGDDVIYSSGPVYIPMSSSPDGGMIAGVVVAVVILVAVVVVVVVVLHRRHMACLADRNNTEESNQDGEGTGTTQPESVSHDPIYMNIENKAFEGDGTQHDEPIYVNEHQQELDKDSDENQYADLNNAADVIASQTYAELKPCT